MRQNNETRADYQNRRQDEMILGQQQEAANRKEWANRAAEAVLDGKTEIASNIWDTFFKGRS